MLRKAEKLVTYKADEVRKLVELPGRTDFPCLPSSALYIYIIAVYYNY